jgi:hypothetical protein
MARKYVLPPSARKIADTTGADGVRTVEYEDRRKNHHVVRIRPDGNAVDTVTTRDGSRMKSRYKVKILPRGVRLETWREGGTVNEVRIGEDGRLEEVLQRTEEKKKNRFSETRKKYSGGRLMEVEVVKRDEKNRRFTFVNRAYEAGKIDWEASEVRIWTALPGGKIGLRSRKKTVKDFGEKRAVLGKIVDEVKLLRYEDEVPYYERARTTFGKDRTGRSTRKREDWDPRTGRWIHAGTDRWDRRKKKWIHAPKGK